MMIWNIEDKQKKFNSWRTQARLAVEKVRDSGGPGFWTAALDQNMLQKTLTRAHEISQRATKFVVIGIGGSSLGPQALVKLLPQAQVYFLDHPEPHSVAQLRAQLGTLHKVHWIWISKSGATLETLVNWSVVHQWCQEQGLELHQHSTVICENKKGPLQAWAQKHKIPWLEIPHDVGGRFSVLTPVGLLPAALAGVDLRSLVPSLESVALDDTWACELVTATLASWERQEWNTILWTYCDQLRPFAMWWQQLWAESLTQRLTRSGGPAPRVSFPTPCIGALDQHSILQNLTEGPKDKWVWILRNQQIEQEGPSLNHVISPEFNHLRHKTLGQIFAAEAEGTLQSLRESGVQVLVWQWPQVTPSSLVYSFLFMEWVVAALGETLDIHAFGQPGVERGKIITQDLLRE